MRVIKSVFCNTVRMMCDYICLEGPCIPHFSEIICYTWLFTEQAETISKKAIKELLLQEKYLAIFCMDGIGQAWGFPTRQPNTKFPIN